MKRDQLIDELHRRRRVEDAWINGAELEVMCGSAPWVPITGITAFLWQEYDYRVKPRKPFECWINTYSTNGTASVSYAFFTPDSARAHAGGKNIARIAVHMREVPCESSNPRRWWINMFPDVKVIYESKKEADAERASFAGVECVEVVEVAE